MQGEAKQRNARHGARHGARQGKARQGKARQNNAGQGVCVKRRRAPRQNNAGQSSLCLKGYELNEALFLVTFQASISCFWDCYFQGTLSLLSMIY